MRDAILLALLNFLGWLPLKLNRLLGRTIGNLYWFCSKKVRHISAINLALCYPDKDPTWRARVAKSGVINMAMTLLESPVLWRLSGEQLVALCENPEAFNPLYIAQDEANGSVVGTPHLGNWEITALLYTEVRPVTALYRPPKIAALDEFIKNGRQHTGVSLVPTNGSGIRQLTKALLKGQAAGILPA